MKARPAIFAHAPAWTRLPPAVTGDDLVLSGADGRFRAYDGVDGSLRWETQAGEESDRFAVNDHYLVSTARDGLSAYDTGNGALLWHRTGSLQIDGLTDNALLASGRGEVQALDPQTGQTIWQTTVHQPALPWKGSVLTVEGERDRRETLQARDPKSGQPNWQTSDGDIQHLVPLGDQILYSATKFGRHHQEVQRVSCRASNGALKWTYRCPGELRTPPLPSPDGSRIALLQKHPADPSRSLFSVIDSHGELLFETPVAMKADVAFMNDGSFVLSETEFSRTPGEEETRLRSLDSQGNEKWSRPGRADWMTSGAQLTVVRGSTLTGIESETGREKWVRQLTGSLAPLDLSGHKLRLSESGCVLHTLNTETGEISETVSSGHTFFVSPNGRISDHEGQIWKDTLPANRSAFVGEWKEVEPFHIGMKAAPTSRLERQAVFVDWDGDEKDDGSDPVLLDGEREIVSWAQLRARDTDSDTRLDTRELSGLNLWFDSDGDGKVSSDAEFRPLLSSSFDKGRIELESELLWLASDSSCGA